MKGRRILATLVTKTQQLFNNYFSNVITTKKVFKTTRFRIETEFIKVQDPSILSA